MNDNTQTSFGVRLRFAMCQSGFGSSRSPYGVDVTHLSEITQHSPQICRKYLKNTALPSVETIKRLSEALDVRPSWLLFGEGPSRSKDLVSLSPALLRCVIAEGLAVQSHFKPNHDFVDFLMHIIERIKGFDLSEAQMRKIIRCMISSVEHLNKD